MPSGYSIPSWIRPPADPAQAYISAFHAGASVAEAQARLQSQADQQATELAVSEQRLKGQQMREQQELEMTKAYHQATLGLRQQELAQTQQRIGMAAEKAAQGLAAQAEYRHRITDLKQDPIEAALATPGLVTSGPGIASLAEKLSARQHPPKPAEVDIDSEIPGYSKVIQNTGHVQFIKKPSSELTKSERIRIKNIIGRLELEKEQLFGPNRAAQAAKIDAQIKGWRDEFPTAFAVPKSIPKRFSYDPASGQLKPVDVSSQPSHDEER